MRRNDGVRELYPGRKVLAVIRCCKQRALSFVPRRNIRAAVHLDCIRRSFEAALWRRRNKKFDSVSQSDSRMIQRTEYSRAQRKTSRRARESGGIITAVAAVAVVDSDQSRSPSHRACFAALSVLRALGSFAHRPCKPTASEGHSG